MSESTGQDRQPSGDSRRDADGPESKGAPVAESHYLVSEHDGVTRVDIADDAEARPGPGPGQPEADEDAPVTDG